MTAKWCGANWCEGNPLRGERTIVQQTYGDIPTQVRVRAFDPIDETIIADSRIPLQPKEKTVFREIATDIKTFIKENKSLIYFIAFALLLDHFLFHGALKARLHAMIEKLMQRVENKVHSE
jgi:hypothetical protein